ncbi:MAG TPA: hypothetical protein VMA13_08255 [Candidatus Saccharimonadales bacterium]|nr:hypothetical protein [Candidatus Saccharimonadales bacterium]
MKHQKKFESQEEQQQISETRSQQKTSAREFGSVEELLRYDTKQTNVPPGIAQRLGRSLQNEPRPAQAWWQRWFGKK